MNSSSSHPTTALVLGGGGALGNAWLVGVLAGLHEAGLDVTGADLIIGTSAGATAAAQVTQTPPAELYAATQLPIPDQPALPGGATRPSSNPLEETSAVIAQSRDAVDMRRRMGAWAIGVSAASDPSERWRATVAQRFPSASWPTQRVLLTAVDAATGDPVVFDSESGVDLVDAVAASTAGMFAYRIGDRQYLDGGYRTNAENADLAGGYDRVLVLSPFGARTRLPLEWHLDLATQVDELRAAGSHVETIYPDRAALEAFGDNMMNYANRAPAALAGHEQGSAAAERLTPFWQG